MPDDQPKTFEQFIKAFTDKADQLDRALDTLDRLSVYDDVKSIMAYVPLLKYAATNKQLGASPKLRLQTLHNMAKDLYDRMGYDPENPVEKSTVTPKEIADQGYKILAFSGRANDQINEIISEEGELSEALYNLIRASEATAFGIDSSGKINLEAAEEYLYQFFTKDIKSLRLGKSIAPLVDETRENTKQISGDIKA